MNKKVAIIGSCNTRELFNYDILKNNFDIVYYGFQVCMYDLFSEPINLPDDIIQNIPIENFNRRMLDEDANKKVIKATLDANADILILDFYSLIRDPIKITYNGKSCYVSNTRFNEIIKNLQSKNISCKLIPFNKIDKQCFLHGLDLLCEFVTKNFIEKQKKVIVLYPAFNNKYLDVRGRVLDYPQQVLNSNNFKYETLLFYENYFTEKLKGCKIFKPKPLSGYSVHVQYDQETDLPSVVHHPKYDELKFACELYNIINNKNEGFDLYTLLAKEFDKLNNFAFKLVCDVNKSKSNLITNLNNIVYNLIDLDKHIVIISAKDECSVKLPRFMAKTKLGLKMPVEFRQSYVAIIDKNNSFIFEQNSSDKIIKNYEIEGLKVDIKSAGILCGYISSIIINGKEYSKNERGLNFVIIDNKTLNVVSSFSCDTFYDDNLIVKLENKF